MEEKYFVGGYVDDVKTMWEVRQIIEQRGMVLNRRQIHSDYEFECTVEDVRSYLDGNDEQLTDEQIERAARLVMRDIGNNDARAEAYWMSFENAIDEVREEDAR
jgi:hypothetical protein